MYGLQVKLYIEMKRFPDTASMRSLRSLAQSAIHFLAIELPLSINTKGVDTVFTTECPSVSFSGT